MKAAERQQQIVQLTRAEGVVSVEELGKRFGVTPSTIRRDLAQLTDAGRITRTFGGVTAATAPREAGLRQRVGEAFEQKRAIATWASGRVDAGAHVMLDSGSTVTALAHELRVRDRVTVTTTGLTVMTELSEADGITLRALGGTLRPKSQGFVGPFAEAALERLTFDAAFLGADGVAAERGLSEAEDDQTRLKEIVAARSTRVYVLAHSAKLGDSPFHSWARIPAPWTLVTDWLASDEQVERFRAEGIDVVKAESAGA